MSLPRVEALIFAEHQKFSIENPLLKEKIKALEELNHLYIKSDSLQRNELDIQKQVNSFNEQTISKLQKNIKIYRILSVAGVCLFIGSLL